MAAQVAEGEVAVWLERAFLDKAMVVAAAAMALRLAAAAAQAQLAALATPLLDLLRRVVLALRQQSLDQASPTQEEATAGRLTPSPQAQTAPTD
jgi:hypothetical protein